MSEKFDTVRSIRNPRFSKVTEGNDTPSIQYLPERRESGSQTASIIIGLVLLGMIVFQQFQYMQLRNDFQVSQVQTHTELETLRSNLATTNEKTDAAIEAIKQTQNRQKICNIPVIGSTLCAIKTLQEATTNDE